MRKASWVMLTLMASAMLVFSLVSAWRAYGPDPYDQFGTDGPRLSDVKAWNPVAATALLARRGTAAAFSAAYAALLLVVVLVPYRRGERWAWWAVLASVLVLAALTLLRIPVLGTSLGAATGGIPLVVTLVALLLDVRR